MSRTDQTKRNSLPVELVASMLPTAHCFYLVAPDNSHIVPGLLFNGRVFKDVLLPVTGADFVYSVIVGSVIVGLVGKSHKG